MASDEVVYVPMHRAEGDAGGVALDEIGRQARGLVRHLDALDLRMKPIHGALVAAQRLAIDRELFLARRDETLGAVIIVAGAHVLIAGGDLAAFGVGLVAIGGDPV